MSCQTFLFDHKLCRSLFDGSTMTRHATRKYISIFLFKNWDVEGSDRNEEEYPKCFKRIDTLLKITQRYQQKGKDPIVDKVTAREESMQKNCQPKVSNFYWIYLWQWDLPFMIFWQYCIMLLFLKVQQKHGLCFSSFCHLLPQSDLEVITLNPIVIVSLKH